MLDGGLAGAPSDNSAINAAPMTLLGSVADGVNDVVIGVDGGVRGLTGEKMRGEMAPVGKTPALLGSVGELGEFMASG